MICIFKCPGCNSNMTFNVEKQKLECMVCGAEIAVDDYDAGKMTLDGGVKCGDETSSYLCPTCGAEMLTETAQATCTCSYCGTGMAVFGSGEGKVSPEKIIPFTVTREQAETYFRQWWMEHDTMPEFNLHKMKLEIRPMYLPVWLVNANVRTDTSAIVRRMETVDEVKYQFGSGNDFEDMMHSNDAISRLSDKQKVTKRYVIRKLVESRFDRVPNNASYHFSSTRFQGIEPYDYNYLEDFEPAYLSGFPAEQYSVEINDVIPRTIRRVRDFGENQCRNYILGSGAGVSEIETEIHSAGTVELKEACYALVPVWVCSYLHQKKHHSVYVNGQTGKADGEVLIGEERTAVSFITMFLGAFWEFFGILFLLSISFWRIFRSAAGSVFLSMAFVIIFSVIALFKGGGVVNSGTMEGFEWDSQIAYNQRSRSDPKRVRIKKFIIGTVCFAAGAILYSVSARSAGMSLWPVLPKLLVMSAAAGFLWTLWFMKKHIRTSIRKETVEYSDYVKAAQSVILESSEKLL